MTRAIRFLIAAFGGVILAAIVALAVTGPALAPVPAASPTAARATPTATPSGTPTTVYPDIDGARARAHVAYLADKARGGRYTASRGYDEAAQYMAERFAEIGLEPWGDAGTFFHRYRTPLVDLAATPVLQTGDGRRFRHRTDFTERVGGTFGSGNAEGQLVFIGSGLGSGPTSDFAKVDVRGKVAIVITAGRADPARELASRGAAAAIYVTTSSVIKFSYLPRFEPVTLPGVVITGSVADELLAPSGKTWSALRSEVEAQVQGLSSSSPPPSPAFELPTRARVAVPLTPLREVEAKNVVGLLRGTDPDASKRAVIVGGHLDGIGTDPDGTVMPGANDNASGPGLTIEVARALAARKAELRYSVIFVAFASEEQGFGGSEAFVTQFSAIPGRRESLVGYVNLDVVGCCGGSVHASNESDLMVARARRAGEALGVTITSTGSGSSDQLSFSRRGVHATLLNWSSLGPIHTTEDTIDRIEAEHLRTIGKIAALMTLEMAAGR